MNIKYNRQIEMFMHIFQREIKSFLSCFKNAKWILYLVYDYLLGFEKNTKKNLIINSLLFRTLRLSYMKEINKCRP